MLKTGSFAQQLEFLLKNWKFSQKFEFFLKNFGKSELEIFQILNHKN